MCGFRSVYTLASKAAFSRQTLNGAQVLVPIDDDGRDILAALKPDSAVMVELFTPRNVRHHRLLFALFKKLCDGGVWEGDVNTFKDWAKFATGHVRTAVDHLGNPHYVPKSIAFESMDQATFNRWFDRVVYLVVQRLLNNSVEWEALKQEIIEAVDGAKRYR